MSIEDYDHGVLECLSQLTELGAVSREGYTQVLEHWRSQPDVYYPFVLVVAEPEPPFIDRVIGTGMLFVERKLIHGCGMVGHIEDIVVHDTYRGKNLGKVIIEYLTNLAQSLGCYKVILDCSEKNQQFYAKCGYITKGTQMAKYF